MLPKNCPNFPANRRVAAVVGIIILAVCNLVAIGFILYGLAVFFVLCLLSSNLPVEKDDAIQTTLEWARLAPLPDTAKNIHVESGGTVFTRSLLVRFEAPVQRVTDWTKASPSFENPIKSAYLDVPGSLEHTYFAESGSFVPEDSPFSQKAQRAQTGNKRGRYHVYLLRAGGGAMHAEASIDEKSGEVIVIAFWS